MMNDPLDVTTIRQMVMGEYWPMARQGVDLKVARRKAVELVAVAVDMTPEELESALSADMRKSKKKQEAKAIKKEEPEIQTFHSPTFASKPKFTDDNTPQFYDDMLDDSPMEKVYWLRDQITGMAVDTARACLFDKEDEAMSCKKDVPKAVRLVGWKHTKKNPGFYTEVLQIGFKWKLRVKRLR